MCDLQIYLSDIIKCYTDKILSLENQIRLGYKRERRLRNRLNSLNYENKLFREEIDSLELSDRKLRDLLCKDTKRKRFLEGNKYLYTIRYRLKYQYNSDIDSDYKYSEWFDDEYSVLEYFNKLLNVKSNFVIEREYTKDNWDCDSNLF